MTLEALAQAAAERGFWMEYRSPFTVRDHHVIGFTTHGSTGWNGRADIVRAGPTLAQALAEAKSALLQSKPGDLDRGNLAGELVEDEP